LKTPQEILIEARAKRNLTQTELGALIGLGLRAVQKLEDGEFPKYKKDSIVAIDKVLGTNLYEQIYERVQFQTAAELARKTSFTGKFDHKEVSRVAKNEEIDYTTERRIKKNLLERQRIPLYDAPASAGITEQDMTPVHAPSGTIDVGDLLHDSESAIRIYGNSMTPNYPPGCVVGLVKCNSLFIEPGEVYVIETRDRRLLKRVFYKNDDTSGDALHLYSDNIMKFEGGARDGRLAYPPFDLPKSEIIALYQVTGVIKRNANSVILNR
jgi:transcriptional regulator with XRE-family HTH domain